MYFHGEISSVNFYFREPKWAAKLQLAINFNIGLQVATGTSGKVWLAGCKLQVAVVGKYMGCRLQVDKGIQPAAEPSGDAGLRDAAKLAYKYVYIYIQTNI